MEFDFKLPGLGRPESSRPKRIAEAVKNELNILLLRHVADPRLKGVFVSQVMVTPDMKQAKVFFIVPKGLASNPALKGMRRAKGFFRSHLAQLLNLRYTPDMLFYFDEYSQEAVRIEALLQQINTVREHDEQS